MKKYLPDPYKLTFTAMLHEQQQITKDKLHLSEATAMDCCSSHAFVFDEPRKTILQAYTHA
jgi:hypothetical protein